MEPGFPFDAICNLNLNYIQNHLFFLVLVVDEP